MSYLDADMLVATVFGERLKELRDSRRLTQDVLASQVGVSRQTISNWETGTSAPNAVDLPSLAQALGVSVAQLYGDEPDRPTTSARAPAHGPRAGDSGQPSEGLNVGGLLENLRPPGVPLLPIYRWGSLGDPRDHESAPDPDRLVYPPLGREQLVGPNGFGVEVRGESMVGRDIRDGDICWINPDRSYRVGGVVLALVDNGEGDSGMVIKSYTRGEVGDCLVSERSDGKSPVLCREFRIIGPVVWIERGFPPR